MNYGLALPYTTPRTAAKLSQLAEEFGWDACFLGDAIWKVTVALSFKV